MKLVDSPEALRDQVIPADAIVAARADARLSGTRLVDALDARLALPPAEFIRRLAATVRFPALTMDDLHRLQPAFDVLPFADAAQHECVALRDPDGRLVVVFGDPFDARLRAWAEERVSGAFAFRLALSADLRAYLTRHEESMRAMDSVLGTSLASDDNDAEAVQSLSITSISEDDSPVVKLVSSTLYDALKSLASDIHVETTPAGLTIKYRIDGVLVSVGHIAGADLAEQVISRIKVLAELDISERRVPQDGRFKVALKGRAIDFRVSVMPSIFGEDAVLRILDKQALTDQLLGLQLGTLGFDDEAIVRMRKLSREPYGMLLVTGPTGSGKTTTLYAMLSEINTGQEKIITIEDPVEYQLAGVLQIPVNEKKGLTFSRGLRSILRHDPDRILVGEIRDPETAEIAVQAALTGHLVFTTVHANNAFDVIGRFTHMGVEPYIFASAMNGVVAQRLVRMVCADCAVDDQPDAALITASGLARADLGAFRFRIGRGCGRCRGTGYRGRRAIAETLLLDDELRELIVRGEPVRVLREAAARNGTRFLRDAAMDCVRRGESTLQEINRVTLVG
ncbi:GspE/PulE family protein [Ideonella sp. A 288]|uniref:GspE/PulE family protein n=1 Tax=Ideonella sp. A 288 TaxID=1962181 RepID=UPI000B4B12AA|nr:GspE/PulE family protein [Ideonella sp. A 288]